MKLLMPIDGSNASQKTLHWAAQTFDPQNTEYYLLFVVQVLPDLNTVEFDITDAAAMLHRAQDDLEARGCKVAKAEYVLGDTVQRICEYAEAYEIDQVIIGTHGRTGLARFLMGSVSAKVLEQCHRPVTVHRNVEPKALAEHAEHSYDPAHTII